jgi:CheY-like chemotaxis protein
MHEAQSRSIDGTLGRPSLGGGLIVVADDDRDTADSVAVLLRLSGHTVRVAYTGDEALALIRAHHPRVALLDLRMPRVDGYEIARRVRAEGLSDVRLIAVTGLTGRIDWPHALECGFEQVLLKPVEPAEFETVLRRSGPLR